MKEFFQQLRWQFVLLHRNNLINISVGVTALYALIFYLFKDTPYTSEVLTLLLYSDPTLIGLLFFGLMVILERNQMVLSAFLVSPMNRHVYLLARVVSLSVVGWACATGMALAALGWNFDLLQFSLGAFLMTLLFSLAGVWLISFTDEVLNYILLSVPILIIMSLPLLPYFDLLQGDWIGFLPTQGPTNLMLDTYDVTIKIHTGLSYGMSMFWVVIFYIVAYQRFFKTIKD